VSRKLIVNDGRRQRELLLVSKIVVGRDPTCDLSEADPLLSRRHAEFSISGDDIVVRDLGSRNGIYINGTRIAEGTLQSGDIVRVGHLQMQYVEDAMPLVSVPELLDDATGLVIPGPRGPATPKSPTPSVIGPRPTGASDAVPKPAPPSAAIPRPAPPSPRPRPAAAPRHEQGVDVTSFVPPPAMHDSPPSHSGSQPPSAALPKPAPPNPDEVEQTRVVPAPGRSGLRPKPEPMQPAPGEYTSVQPPPVIHTAVQPPPMALTAVQPPPVMHTAVQPPPAPPVEDIDEPTSVVLAPRPRTRVAPAPSNVEPPPVAMPTRHAAREARALRMAVAAIGAFLGSASISQSAADAIKTLERDLASAEPPADLVAALKGLAARLGAAANELT
jgi:hypothetical protein